MITKELIEDYIKSIKEKSLSIPINTSEEKFNSILDDFLYNWLNQFSHKDLVEIMMISGKLCQVHEELFCSYGNICHFIVSKSIKGI